MDVVFDTVLPVFAVMLAGWIAGRLKLLGPGGPPALNAFVYYAALPALLLRGLARAPIEAALDPQYLGGYALGSIALFVPVLWAGLRRGDRLRVAAMRASAAIFANTGYLGVPLFAIARGEANVLPAVVPTMFISVVVVTATVALCELDVRSGAGAARAVTGSLKALPRNPLLIGCAAGLLLAWAKLPLPRPVDSFCQILGAAAGPAALFAIGLFLATCRLRGTLGDAAAVTAVKLFAHPAAAGLIAWFLLGLRGDAFVSLLVVTALPVGALTFTLAQRYNTHVESVSAGIVLSTVLSLVTLSVLVAVTGWR